MKITFLILFLIFVQNALACGKKVDPQKVVVFIDTNYSYLEMQKAKEAACERGESFKLIPYSEADVTAVGKLYGAHEAAKTQQNNCFNTYNKAASNERYEKCKSFSDKTNKTWDELKAKSNEQKKKQGACTGWEWNNDGCETFSQKVKKELDKLAKDKIAPTSISMSGHDGGSLVSGMAGGLGKAEMGQLFTESYKDNPDLLKQVDSVLLLGCYTVNPNDINLMKTFFPEMGVYAGFYGSGPSNQQPASRNFVHDIILRSKSLAAQKTQKAVESSIRAIESFNQTYAGVYVDTNCGEYWAYNKKNYATQKSEYHFEQFDSNVDCGALEAKLNENSKKLALYMVGATPIPENTSSSDLVDMYAYARQNSNLNDECSLHKISNIHALDADRIGFLRFFKGVQKNFAKVFNQDILAANKIIEEYKKTGVSHLLQKYHDNLTIAQKKYDDEMAKLAGKETEITNQENLITDLKIKLDADKSISKHLKNKGLSLDEVTLENLATLDLNKKDTELMKEYLASLDRRKVLFKERGDLINKTSNIENGELATAKTIKEMADHQASEIELNLKELDLKTPEQLGTMTKKEINDYATKLNPILSSTLLYQTGDADFVKASNYVNKIENYLVNLEPACMDFLEWHEDAPGSMPKAKCGDPATGYPGGYNINGENIQNHMGGMFGNGYPAQPQQQNGGYGGGYGGGGMGVGL